MSFRCTALHFLTCFSLEPYSSLHYIYWNECFLLFSYFAQNINTLNRQLLGTPVLIENTLRFLQMLCVWLAEPISKKVLTVSSDPIKLIQSWLQSYRLSGGPLHLWTTFDGEKKYIRNSQYLFAIIHHDNVTHILKKIVSDHTPTHSPHHILSGHPQIKRVHVANDRSK